MKKAKKLNGVPTLMVPVDVFLELARAYSHSYPGKQYIFDMPTLEAKAYRKFKNGPHTSGQYWRD